MSFDELFAAGRQAVREKHWEEAIEHLEAAFELEDDRPELLCLLGVCYAQLKQYVEAELYLSKACELAPQVAQYHYNLGRTFHARGRLEMAIRSYENALRADRGYAPARTVLKDLGVTLSPDLRDEEEPAATETGDGHQPPHESPGHSSHPGQPETHRPRERH